MFSGIVQALSKKVKFEEKDYGYKLSVTVPANFTKKLKKGDSVAVNGVCLTVVDFKKDLIEFDVVHESIKLTNISDKFSSIPFNLERSLKIGDEVGGHFVSGHGMGKANLDILATLGEHIHQHQFPFIGGAVFQNGREDLIGSEFPSRVGGKVVAAHSSMGTCRNPQGESVIDFFSSATGSQRGQKA